MTCPYSTRSLHRYRCIPLFCSRSKPRNLDRRINGPPCRLQRPHLTIIETNLNRGANINARNDKNKTPLHLAASSSGAAPPLPRRRRNWMTRRHGTSLRTVVTASTSLSGRATASYRRVRGASAASRGGCYRFASGELVGARYTHGMTALNLAAGLLLHLRSGWHSGYYRAGDIGRRTGTRELLHRREVLGAETDNAKRLCTSRRVMAAIRLLQSGAGTEMGCGIGRTALHVAAINCHAHTALVLLDGGANRKAKTAIREMALHLAVLGRSVSSILALLLRGANITALTDWDYDAESCCQRWPQGGYRGYTSP